MKITVSKKADSLFPIVSAASICAKVTRDAALKNWKFNEKPGEDIDSNWGSGYPNGKINTLLKLIASFKYKICYFKQIFVLDPVTKDYLKKNVEPVFGFPGIVRFCWSTSELILKNHAAQIDWQVFIIVVL